MKHRDRKSVAAVHELTCNPFVSEAQRRWMHANHPEMAERWEEHTPKGVKLPKRKRKKPTANMRRLSPRARMKLIANRGLQGRGKSPKLSKLDPSRTATMRRAFEKRLAAQFAALKGAIVKAVGKDNQFGLQEKVENVGGQQLVAGSGGMMTSTETPLAAGVLNAQLPIAVDFDRTIVDSDGESPIDLSEAWLRDGAKEGIAKLRALGWRVVIYTARPDLDETARWLSDHGIAVDGVEAKMPFKLLIDDRAVDARNPWDEIMDDVEGRLVGNSYTGPHQPADDPDQLYSLAPSARSEMLDLLAPLGCRVVEVDGLEMGELEERLRQPGCVLVVPPVKGRERAGSKVERDYRGDWSRLLDVVRCTVAFDSLAELRRAMGSLGLDIVRIKDRFAKPLPNGYRDALTNIALPSGFVVEVQWHVKPMLIARERLHLAYEAVRGICGGVRGKGREVCAQLESQAKELYARAAAEAGLTENAQELYQPFVLNGRVGWFPCDPRQFRLNEVPDERQPNHFYCGASAARGASLYFGWATGPIDRVARELGTTVERSTRPEAIAKFFRQRPGAIVHQFSDMDIDQLAWWSDQGYLILTPVQDYMGRRSPQAEFDYGHWLTVIGVGMGYVFCQDSSLENWAMVSGEQVPGGDVPKEKEQDANLNAPGRVQIREDDFMEAWHDVGITGKKYVRWGVVVGREGCVGGENLGPGRVANANPEGCNQYTGPDCSVSEDTSETSMRRVVGEVFPEHSIDEKYHHVEAKLPGNRWVIVRWLPSLDEGASVAKVDFGIEGKSETYSRKTVASESLGLARKLKELVARLHSAGFKIRAAGSTARRTDAYERMLKSMGLVKDDEGTWNYRQTLNASAAENLESFQRWLRTQLTKYLRGKTQEQLWDAYIKQGFAKGAGRAFDDVKKPHAKVVDDQTKDFYAGGKQQFLESAFGQPVAKEKVQLLASCSFDELENVTEDMSNKMSRALTDGLVQGKSPREVASDMTDEVDISLSRARMVARTELLRAHNEGQLVALKGLGVQQVGVDVEWLTATDPCPDCAAMAGTVYPVDEASGVLPAHPNCVLGASRVVARDAKALLQAKYTGEVVELITAKGRRLTVTPNHMLLCEHGFLSARFFCEGLHVIDASLLHSDFVAPDDCDDVPCIADVFVSFSETFGVLTKRMEAAPEQLHGDAAFCDPEVDVVWTDGELRDNAGSILCGEIQLVPIEIEGVERELPAYSSGAQPLERILVAADSSVGRCRESLATLLGCLLHATSHTFAAIGHGDAVLLEDVVHVPSADVELLRDCVRAHPLLKQVEHLLLWDACGCAVVSESVASFVDSIADSVPWVVQLLRDVTPGAAEDELLDCIVSVEHRYLLNEVVCDVTTCSSVYELEGVVSSNCRCCFVPNLDKVTEDEDDEATENVQTATKPAVCTCKNWPNVKLRNGSTHMPECPVHQSWIAAGGFQNKDKHQGEDGLWVSNSNPQGCNQHTGPGCSTLSDKSKALLKGARERLAAWQRQVDKVIDKPVLRQIKAASSFTKSLTQRFYGRLADRYGHATATAILLSGQALGWAALGAGAMAGVPLWLPGSSIWGAIPAVAMAEVGLQAVKAVRKLTSNAFDPEQIRDAHGRWVKAFEAVQTKPTDENFKALREAKRSYMEHLTPVKLPEANEVEYPERESMSEADQLAEVDWQGGVDKTRGEFKRGELSSRSERIRDALERAPVHKGYMYRGLSEDVVAGLKVGDVFSDKAPASHSAYPEESDNFSYGRAMLKVKSETGRLFGDRAEGEVVSMPGTKYRVVSVQHNVKLQHEHGEHPVKTFMELEEISPATTNAQVDVDNRAKRLAAAVHRAYARWVADSGVTENKFCPTGEGGGVDPICGSKFVGQVVGKKEHEHAAKVEKEVAEAVGGEHEPDNKFFDVQAGKHFIEVKLMLKGGKTSISVHPDALIRKVDGMKANKGGEYHTVVVDERKTYADGEHAENYSGNRVYYKRGSRRYSLSQMHQVASLKELRILLDTPAKDLPDKAKGSLPKGEAVKKLRRQAEEAHGKRLAKDRARKARLKAEGKSAYERQTED